MSSLSFKQGDVVIADVRYSNFETSKYRPALVASSDSYNRTGDDIILIKITSKIKNRPFDILLNPADLEFGRMKVAGVIKSDFLIVMEKKLIRFVVGKVKQEVVQQVKNKLKEIFYIN